MTNSKPFSEIYYIILHSSENINWIGKSCVMKYKSMFMQCFSKICERNIFSITVHLLSPGQGN